MKLAMTLLVRDEADIVDTQIAFHLALGVDVVIATDNRSQDGTTEILERYEREGVLQLIREDGDDLRQSEWVTRMARLAAAEHGADWIINSDADEFWWPRGGSFREILRSVPGRFGVIRGAWRNFVPRPEIQPLFAERMTVRLCRPTYLDDPLATVFKSVHRASPEVRVGRGNHEAFADGLVALRGWYPFEIFHFPVRSREQCRRKYVTQYLALARNPEKGTPGQIVEAYEADAAGRFDEFYAPLVLRDDEVERGLARGELAVDTRLRDHLRTLAVTADPGSRSVVTEGQEASRGRPTIGDDASFASEVSVIPESDLALALEDRVRDLEARAGRLERSLRLPRRLTRLGRRYGPAR
jgi:hypothetical protein